MRIDTTRALRLVYSLSMEEGIGHVIHAYIFELNDKNELTLKHQRVTPGSLPNFAEFNTPENQEIVALIEEFSPNAITKRFSKKAIKPAVFLKKFSTADNIEKFLKPYFELRLNKILHLLRGQTIYLRYKDNPAETALIVAERPARAEFHFKRLVEGTSYRIKIIHNGAWVNVSQTSSELLCNSDGWILVGSTIYHFKGQIEGKRLVPFFSKEVVEVKKNSERAYFQKFVKQTAEKFDTILKGVNTTLEHVKPSFKGIITDTEPPKLKVQASYQNNLVDIDSTKQRLLQIVTDEKDFHLITFERSYKQEQEGIELLKSLGFTYSKNSFFTSGPEAPVIDLVNKHHPLLVAHGFQFETTEREEELFIGHTTISFSISENIDWFDVKAVIRFGEFEIPFHKLRKNILNNDPKFKLPNGQWATIPQEWFAEFRYIFAFAENDGDKITLNKQHQNLIAEESSTIKLLMKDEPEKSHLTVPPELKSILRPYQKDGFDWLSQLRANHFSGVLADDMGLGKTLQTITLLKAHYAELQANGADTDNIDLFTESMKEHRASLVVVPSSLVYNWAAEIRRFAPSLKAHIHVGHLRSFDPIIFKKNHILITTYGLLRNDAEFLSKQEFEYIILDESQTIKNPTSKIAKAVGTLNTKHRLALTGTPIENSLSDLWSQMNFLNKGLLGSYTFFKSEFVTPIEKNNDENKKNKLKKLVYPFILRRTKEEVAKELPPVSEQILVCEMTEEQESLYDEVKSQYRNFILNELEDPLQAKNRFLVLKGLTELRLIANHPKIYDENLTEESGKFKEITERLIEIQEAQHNILVFSQFTRHLNLLEKLLIEKKLEYSMLTGATTNRQKAVEKFTKNDSCNIFLISLKAGGVGLNLTKADYVFLLDPWWNPFAEKQAIDRAHRIGQMQNVFSYKFITKNTIEEKIMQLQQRKLALAGEFIPTGPKESLIFDREDLEELFS